MRCFRERAERFAAEIDATTADDAAYASLLESMGYASNRETFRLLAETVPYAWIMSLPARDRSAALLEAAGLASGEPLAPARLPASAWRLARIRPGNHPEARIRAVAALLERGAPSLSGWFAHLVAAATKPRQVASALLVADRDHHRLGLGRADEVAVSVVLPLVHALDETGKAEALFSAYPSPPATRWTRTMQALVADAGHEYPVRSALDHQGMHALYTQHCRRERRTACPVCGPGWS
jgi:hypothetical protein